MAPINALYNVLKEKAMKRLVFEKMQNDKRLKDPNGPYFQNPAEYAMDRFSYYTCFLCKEIYFGGKKECEQNMDRDFYKAEELVCPSCSCRDSERSNCAMHGKDFIEFKCKFCCSIACWFCWGNTHFCDPCHRRQNAGERMNKKNKKDLPRCPGPSSCPLKVQHAPNGEECALGCAVCRNLAERQEDF